MSSELRVDKIIPTGGVPTGGGGGVIQVVQKLFTSTFISNVYPYTDVTGFTADITPKFSTSKILCFGHIAGMGTSNTRALYRLLRTISGGSGVPLGEGNDNIGNWSSANITTNAEWTSLRWFCCGTSHNKSVGSNGVFKVYNNGSLRSTRTQTFDVSGYGDINSMAFNGSSGNTVRMGAVSLYNRVLTDLEFEQNFNALKGRYGY